MQGVAILNADHPTHTPSLQVSEMPQLTPPEDKTITSLYVGGVESSITEKDLR